MFFFGGGGRGERWILVILGFFGGGFWGILGLAGSSASRPQHHGDLVFWPRTMGVYTTIIKYKSFIQTSKMHDAPARTKNQP